jgi:hypothetical protein
MGAVVSFAKEVGKMALKGAISATVGSIPIIGSAASGWINSKFAKGGKILKFADGGIVTKLEDKGFKVKEINTPAQLLAAVKKFPDQAAKVGLTASMIKEAVAEHGPMGNTLSKEAEPELQPEAPPTMKRGGRRHKHHGHVEELSVEPVAKAHRKHHHKKHHKARESIPPYAHGGMVASLPWSNLDRLGTQVHARGGYHHHDTGLHMGLHRGEGEQSYVHLMHGGPRH